MTTNRLSCCYDTSASFKYKEKPQHAKCVLRFSIGADDGNRTHTTSLGSWSSTTKLHPRSKRGMQRDVVHTSLVRMNGLEPSTPCMSSRYSNQLSYTLKWTRIMNYALVRRMGLEPTQDCSH